jgi:hypothetical protein
MSRNQHGAQRTAAEQLADLAGRLTDRDRTLCRLLADHQVLTTHQCAQLVYQSPDAVQHRLVALARLRVVDRFRPLARVGCGSAPYHYVLGEAGATVLAAERGVEVADLGYRRDRALAIAHTPQLSHLLAVNGFFARLAATARDQPGTALCAWWSARRCADRWGTIVRPHGYGRWRDGHADADFFLEHHHRNGTGDRGWLDQLSSKLTGYADLATGSGISTPVLLWLPDHDHETHAHQALRPPPVRVATAAAPAGCPSGAVWLPLGRTGPRHRLVELGSPSVWTPAGAARP